MLLPESVKMEDLGIGDSFVLNMTKEAFLKVYLHNNGQKNVFNVSQIIIKRIEKDVYEAYFAYANDISDKERFLRLVRNVSRYTINNHLIHLYSHF